MNIDWIKGQILKLALNTLNKDGQFEIYDRNNQVIKALSIAGVAEMIVNCANGLELEDLVRLEWGKCWGNWLAEVYTVWCNQEIRNDQSANIRNKL